MDSERISQLLGEYADAFGEDVAELLAVPNYLGDARLGPALQSAIEAGTPITAEGAESLFGPAFREAVL